DQDLDRGPRVTVTEGRYRGAHGATVVAGGAVRLGRREPRRAGSVTARTGRPLARRTAAAPRRARPTAGSRPARPTPGRGGPGRSSRRRRPPPPRCGDPRTGRAARGGRVGPAVGGRARDRAAAGATVRTARRGRPASVSARARGRTDGSGTAWCNRSRRRARR